MLSQEKLRGVTDVSQTVEFSLGGLGVRVHCAQPEFRNRLEFDFAAFEPFETPFLEFSVSLGEPDLPANLKESFRGPYGVCFDQGSTRHILYPGPVWVQFDFAKEIGQVTGVDLEFVYERLYLGILSRLGEALENQGQHRVHALGVDTPRGGALFLFPARMGKSTLASSLLRQPGWRLYSEDTPLVDQRGRIHSLPFRLGVRHRELAEGFPEEMVSSSFDKTLIRADLFEIQTQPGLCHSLFLGAWTTGPEAHIESVSRARVLAALLRDLLVGVGIPQVAELFLRPGLGEAAAKAWLAARRLKLALRLASSCDCYRFYLAPDPAQNVARLQRWACEGP